MRVAIVTTVLNEAENTRVLLASLKDQTRKADEVVIVDGGSRDNTVETIREFAAKDPTIKLVEKPGANIGQGRNAGIEHSTCEIIASTDTGCRLNPDWLEKITRPFEDGRDAEFVAGFYHIDPRTLMERVVGTATMRGALDPVDPDTFNPSCRSMAFTRELWQRAGRYPDFLAIDDTLFDHKVRRMNVRWVFAEDAVVHWRPRGTFKGLYKQFRFYGSSAGHTQLYADGCLYNLRNTVIILATIVAAIAFHPAALLATAALLLYFHVHGFHNKAVRIARKLRDWRAYPLAIAVNTVITYSDLVGYLEGTFQRWADPQRYRDGLTRYLDVKVQGTSATT